MADEAHKDKKAAAEEVDYTLANPDTLTKYKAAAEISHKVLAEITKKAKAGVTILSLCDEGDQLLKEETEKVFKGKKITKGIGFPTTISPNDIITPFSPPADETPTIRAGDVLKIQLGAHIDGFAAIAGGTVVAPAGDSDEAEITGDKANLLLATHYAHEVLLRLLLPPSVNAEEGKDIPKAPTQSKINSILQKVASSYGCTVVESTTSYLMERNEIEGKKRVVLSPGENVKGEGSPEVGEVWGVEVALSLGNGKIKPIDSKATLYRKTSTTYALKRESARKTLTDVSKNFSNFPFASRMLTVDATTAKMGLLECVRGNVIRQYEIVGSKDGQTTSREFGVIGITKKGITRIAHPAPINLEKVKSDKKIEDEEILKLLEIPLSTAKPKKKKADV